MECAVELKGIKKTYSGKHAVNNLNMKIGKGEICGLVGKNGAGKTTLMRILAGLTFPDEGNVVLFENENLSEARNSMGILIENPALYPDLDAHKNLQLFKYLYGVEEESILELLELVGLGNVGSKLVKNYSLGMKQRLGIAVALLGNPKLLILDEPINGMDVNGVKEVRDMLITLNRERGVTILISSHILEELVKLATSFYIIDKGTIIESFSVEELNIKCGQYISLRTNNLDEVCRVLEESMRIKNYKIHQGNEIRIYEQLDQTHLINQCVVEAGLRVDAIGVKQIDFESYFIEITEG